MQQFKTVNSAYFTEPMCKLIIYSVPLLAIYDKKGECGNAKLGKERFLNKNWQFQRDNIEFTKDWAKSNEDTDQMNVLKWLQSKNQRNGFNKEAFTMTLCYYNELARKFLLEGKF